MVWFFLALVAAARLVSTVLGVVDSEPNSGGVGVALAAVFFAGGVFLAANALEVFALRVLMLRILYGRKPFDAYANWRVKP